MIQAQPIQIQAPLRAHVEQFSCADWQVLRVKNHKRYVIETVSDEHLDERLEELDQSDGSEQIATFSF